MQLKKQGSSYSVIRTVYSAEKKRGVPTSLGTIPVGGTRIPEELAAKMTSDEVSDVQRKLNEIAESEKQLRMKNSLLFIHYQIDSAINSLSQGVRFESEKQAQELLKQLAQLKAAMRKAGYKRPRSSALALGASPEVAQELKNSGEKA